jgi:hypothetical protein
MEGMKDHDDNIKADGLASYEEQADKARLVPEEQSLLSDNVVDNNKTLGTAEKFGVMSSDHDSLIQHRDQTEKLDQHDGSNLADSIVSIVSQEEDKKMSLFLDKKHLIAGRITAGRKSNNDNDPLSLLDQKRLIAGRSKAASNKNYATRNNDNDSDGNFPRCKARYGWKASGGY